MNSILSFVPQPLRRIIEGVPDSLLRQVEEIRIRAGRPLELIFPGEYRFVTVQSGLTVDPRSGYCPTREECLQLLDLLTNHSVYTFEEELRRGFITVAGGHRVGLAGRTVLERGSVRLIRDIAGFNIRLARERKGVALPVLPALWNGQEGRLHQTLVVSPPQQGKTTLIRDLARLISAGGWGAPGAVQAGRKVGIVDERSEIAACVKGVPTFDVGPRTDVLDGCPKAEGMMMFIRSMSPDVLVVDEVGRPEDADAIREALHAGIGVIATAHGLDAGDVRHRPAMRELMADRVFTRFVVLRKSRDAGVLYTVCDEDGRPLERQQTALRPSAGSVPANLTSI